MELIMWFLLILRREEVTEKMSGTADGTFLVRNAIGRGPDDSYTLTLRFSTFIHCVFLTG